jgi:hypothetical protein
MGATIVVLGGERDGGEVVHDITKPYRAREITLCPLESVPESMDVPLHQFGGIRPNPSIPALPCALCSQEMRFIGVLAYDDLNVPLYENGDSPVALIIGDNDRMYLEVCETCQCIGLQWVH